MTEEYIYKVECMLSGGYYYLYKELSDATCCIVNNDKIDVLKRDLNTLKLKNTKVKRLLPDSRTQTDKKEYVNQAIRDFIKDINTYTGMYTTAVSKPDPITLEHIDSLKERATYYIQ